MIREFNYYFYKSRLLLVAIGILLFSGNVIANDGGFVGYGDGSTVIPVNNNHIEMLAEEVVCSINDGYADFVCVFYFLNTSTKPQEVLMGFPITIDFLVEGPDGAPYDWKSGIFTYYGDAEDISNIMSNIKSNRDFLVEVRKDIEKHYRFRAFVDGVEVPTEFKYIDLKYLDGNEEYGNVAFLWKVKFEPREAKVITNIYRQPLDNEFSLRFHENEGIVVESYSLNYITLTGKLWKGGKIGRAKFKFDIPIDYRSFVINYLSGDFVYLESGFYFTFSSSEDIFRNTRIIPVSNRTILEIDIKDYVPTQNILISLIPTYDLLYEGNEMSKKNFLDLNAPFASKAVISILIDDKIFDDFYNYYLNWVYSGLTNILLRLDLFLKFSGKRFRVLSKEKFSPIEHEEIDIVWRMFSYDDEDEAFLIYKDLSLLNVSRVVRNAFYARKGYMFKDSELKSYFESYGLKLTNKSVSLTEEEENRILLISLIEDIVKYCEVHRGNVYTALSNVIEKVDTMNMLYMKISNLLSKGITNDIVKVGIDICDKIMFILKSERKNIELFSKKLKIKISKEKFEERLKELEKERERLLKEKEELEKGVGGIVNKLTGKLEKKQKEIYELGRSIYSLSYKLNDYKSILEDCNKLLLGIDNFFRKVNIPMQR